MLVDHGPVRRRCGLVFRRAGKRALVAAGRGADLPVHEVLVHRQMRPVPGRRGGETIAAVAAYHTLSSAVGDVARRMGAPVPALTHFVPPDFDRGALPAAAGEQFEGPIFIGEELVSFDLVRGEVGWRGFRARLP